MSQSTSRMYQNDMIDSLFMHMSYNMRLVLVSPPLSSENYRTWSTLLLITLRPKNELGSMDGTLTRPNSNG